MSDVGRLAALAGRACQRSIHTRRLAAVVTGLVVVLVCLGAAGPAVADLDRGHYAHGSNSTDDTAPNMTSAARINDTTIEVTFTDNHDVDEGSIDADSFLLSHGNVNSTNVSEDGSNATARLFLSEPVNQDSVTVVLDAGSSVQDTNGNAIDPDDTGVTVSGMDGVAPTVRDFVVTDATDTPATLSFQASEPLGGIHVSVLGAVRDRLTAADFSVEGASSYRATYSPAADGTVEFILVNVTDESGNTQPVSIRTASRVDLTPPAVVAGIDFSQSSNLSITFDGSRSRDASNITNLTWRFGDGTDASGERVAHTFRPGAHTVTLSATDQYGNTGTDKLELNLTAGAGNLTDVTNETLAEIRRTRGPVLTVERPNASDRSSSFVRARYVTPGEQFTVTGNGSALAATGNLSLDALDVTLNASESLALGITAAGPDSVGDAARATGTRAIGGFTVVHDAPDTDVGAVRFAFAVGADRLADTPPENVSLLRRHDGEWQRLPTTVRDTTGPTVEFSAESPGFSRFAVVVDTPNPTDTGSRETATQAGTPTATPAPTPSGTAVGIRTVTLASPTVEPGETALVNVTVENSGDSLGQFVAGLSVNGTVVATETIPVPGNSNRTVSLEYATDEPGTYPVSVNGTTAGELTVGSGGGGGLIGSVLGIFGFLPLGLLEPLVVFVGLPVLVAFLVLKGLAIYLGY